MSFILHSQNGEQVLFQARYIQYFINLHTTPRVQLELYAANTIHYIPNTITKLHMKITVLLGHTGEDVTRSCHMTRNSNLHKPYTTCHGAERHDTNANSSNFSDNSSICVDAVVDVFLLPFFLLGHCPK